MTTALFRYPHRFLRCRIGQLSLSAMLLLFPALLRAQEAVDLDKFEEVQPQVKEKKTTKAQQKDKSKGMQFEEIRPEIKEIDSSKLTVKPAEKGGPSEAPVDSRPLAPVRAEPSVPPPPRQIAPAIAVPADSAKLDKKGQAAIDAARQAQIPGQGLSADVDFQQNLNELERKIEALKERVIETKARLLNYSQKVAKGYAAGTQVGLRVRNRLGGDFQIEKLSFYLDGHQVYLKEYDPEEEIKVITAYRGSILPGRHRIDVEVILRGDDGFFDFGYSARLKLESGEYYNANEGKVLQVDLELFDRGGAFKAIEKRPGLRFEIEERDVF